jgi:hypothetical protein
MGIERQIPDLGATIVVPHEQVSSDEVSSPQPESAEPTPIVLTHRQ